MCRPLNKDELGVAAPRGRLTLSASDQVDGDDRRTVWGGIRASLITVQPARNLLSGLSLKPRMSPAFAAGNVAD
jgi:hypothetical protein